MSIVETPKSANFVPPLQPGDRLNRAEFERRYNAMLQRDGKLVMKALNDGLATNEHANFVTQLENRRTS